MFASWGSLGHLTVAEPGALVGFLGPRVYEALYDTPFPPGVQTSENLYEHGLLDAVLPIESLAEVAARALNVLMAPREGLPVVPRAAPREPAGPAGLGVDHPLPAARAAGRAGPAQARRLRRRAPARHRPGRARPRAADRPRPLRRRRRAWCSARTAGTRRWTTRSARPGLREARRGMRLADELKLPLVSVIDTAGAALSKEAEEGGLAGEIARCLAELVMLDAPTVCVLLGQGTGGGALALMPADRVICAQHSWLSPLPPEGASAILYRDTDHAPELAASQGVRSLDLLRDGVVDRIVAEHPDAADEPADFCARMAQVLEHELALLLRADPVTRRAGRLARYRALG